MFAQVLTPEAAETFKYNVLDLTKCVTYVFSFPRWRDRRCVGTGASMTSPRPRSGSSILHRTQKSKQISVIQPLPLLTLAYSYFAEIEQAAFTPSHTVDGWAPSADPVLQARLFSYSGALCPEPPLPDQCAHIGGHFSLDTQRYRLGVNHMVGGYMNDCARYALADHIPAHLANPGERPDQRSRQLPPRWCHERQWEPRVAPELSLHPTEDPASCTPVRRRHAPAVDRESFPSSSDPVQSLTQSLTAGWSGSESLRGDRSRLRLATPLLEQPFSSGPAEPHRVRAHLFCRPRNISFSPEFYFCLLMVRLATSSVILGPRRRRVSASVWRRSSSMPTPPWVRRLLTALASR